MSKQNKEKMLDKKSAFRYLAGLIVLFLFLAAAIVVVFDPFYQYHEPWFGLNAVLNDRDNQVVGTIRTFDYDSVLLGSSVAENYDSSFLDASFDCTTLKVIRASGSTADLLYYLDKAHRRQELKNVFWSMDIFALTASPQITLTSKNTPHYLHTDTVLDDWPYLWNKEILCETIPQMLAFSRMGMNTQGQAYNWARGKNFSAEGAMRAYDKPKEENVFYAAEDSADTSAEEVEDAFSERNPVSDFSEEGVENVSSEKEPAGDSSAEGVVDVSAERESVSDPEVEGLEGISAKAGSFLWESQDALSMDEQQNLTENLSMIEEELSMHPDTSYTIIFPPYSMMWWDCGYVNGVLETYFEVLEQTIPVLLTHNNAKVYFFVSDRDVICNLDNYMDMIHYSPDINQYMLEEIVQDGHRVSEANWEEVLTDMKNTCEYIVKEGIYQYYSR